MTFIYTDNGNSIIAHMFASFPLMLKQHGVKVGIIAGLMAECVPDEAIPVEMTREQYANAVRYGGFYHDIGAYTAHNDIERYPAMGHRIVVDEINQRIVPPSTRLIIRDMVREITPLHIIN